MVAQCFAGLVGLADLGLLGLPRLASAWLVLGRQTLANSIDNGTAKRRSGVVFALGKLRVGPSGQEASQAEPK